MHRLKWLPLLLFGLVASVTGQAQTEEPSHRLCGHALLQQQEPERHAKQARNRADFQAFLAQSQGPERIQSIMRIPVVVHIMHDPSDTYGVESNITIEQIMSQLEVLNEDFRRMPGTRGDNSNPVGADVEIEFCMATRDPNGQPTTGITRQPYAGSLNFQLANQRSMKDLVRWDTERYLNIWVVKRIQSGILAFTYLPEVIAGDTDRVAIDGIVVGATFFGSADKQFGNPPFYLNQTFRYGRTLTHEVGHYLNLYHTWAEGGCDVDDFVDDTPLCSGPYFGCPPSPARPVQCDQERMVENYLDYSDDICFNTFTQGQKTRMRTAVYFYPFRENLISQANLQATGCADTVAATFPDSMFIVAGDPQRGRINAVLDTALRVRVTNPLRFGLNDQDVRFRLLEQPSGSTLSLDTVIRTAGGGFAALPFQLGRLPGTYIIRASANTRVGNVQDFKLQAEAATLAYPNPFSREIVLQLELENTERVEVRVYNIQGQLVLQYETSAREAVLLDMTGYPNQLYIAQLRASSTQKSYKIIKMEP